MDDYQKFYCAVCGISIEDLAYFAGLFDGEGSVRVSVRTNNSRGACAYLCLGNTSRAVLEWVKQRFGGKIYKLKHSSTKHQMWQWQAGGKKWLPLFKALLPLLKIKNAELRVAIEVLEYIHPRGGNIPESPYYFDWLKTKAEDIRRLRTSYKVSVN
jgi:hypothetical protein